MITFAVYFCLTMDSTALQGHGLAEGSRVRGPGHGSLGGWARIRLLWTSGILFWESPLPTPCFGGPILFSLWFLMSAYATFPCERTGSETTLILSIPRGFKLCHSSPEMLSGAHLCMKLTSFSWDRAVSPRPPRLVLPGPEWCLAVVLSRSVQA